MALARKKKAQTPLSWRQCAKTSMLLEISCFLVRKLGEHIPEVTDPNFTSVLKERWQRCKSVVFLGIGRTPGEQRIYRSEIFCIVKVCESLTCADIFTDSQSSLDVVARCQLASKVEELIYLEDYDSVERLWFALQKGSFHFYKMMHTRILWIPMMTTCALTA